MDLYKQFMAYADQVYQIAVGGKKVKKEEKVEEVKPPLRPKVKKPMPSTTPDLIRKPIAQRKYESKASLNLI